MILPITSPGSFGSQRTQKPVGVAHRLLLLDVVAHHRDRKAMRDEPRHAADRARLALEIEDVHVAFGRAVELEDQRDAEAVLELVPQIGPQPVAADSRMRCLVSLGFGGACVR